MCCVEHSAKCMFFFFVYNFVKCHAFKNVRCVMAIHKKSHS